MNRENMCQNCDQKKIQIQKSTSDPSIHKGRNFLFTLLKKNSWIFGSKYFLEIFHNKQ